LDAGRFQHGGLRIHGATSELSNPS
jgi:hypothetical protein